MEEETEKLTYLIGLGLEDLSSSLGCVSLGKSISLSLENEEVGFGGGLGLIVMLLENSQQIPK